MSSNSGCGHSESIQSGLVHLSRRDGRFFACGIGRNVPLVESSSFRFSRRPGCRAVEEGSEGIEEAGASEHHLYGLRPHN